MQHRLPVHPAGASLLALALAAKTRGAVYAVATQAVIGYGTLIQYGDGASPEVFTTIAEVRGEISGPGLERGIPEATHMESPDAYREFIAGLKDGQDVSFEANLLPTNAAQLGARAIFESGVRRNWRLSLGQYSPAVVLGFTAIVQGFGFMFPIEDPTGIEFTLKVTGKPDFVA